MKIVFDPGVIVSAALSEHGVPARLLRLWDDGVFELVVSTRLMRELETVLARAHIAPSVPPERARALIGALVAGSIEVPDPPEPPAVTRDPNDDYLVALAREAGAFALVSGDRHLVELDIRPPVLTPRELLGLLQPS